MMNGKLGRKVRVALCLSAAAVLTAALPLFGGTFSGKDFGASSVQAAEESTDEVRNLIGQSDGYSAVVYTNTSGLPTSEANAIVQTDDGFIWIGSYSGLIRYDGNTFERMSYQTGISGVVELFVDSKGRLWIGSNDVGAAVLENGEFRFFGREQGLSSLYVHTITEDSGGNIYLGTAQGVVVVDPSLEESHAIESEHLTDDNVMQLHSFTDGSVIGLTREGSILLIKNGEITDYYDSKALGFNGAHALLPDPAHPGYMYVGDTGSVIRYGRLANKTFQVREEYKIDPLAYVNYMTLMDDVLWIASDEGIGYIQNGELYPLTKLPMNDSVQDMIGDYLHNLWFCSSKLGVMKLVPNQFMDVSETYELEDRVVYGTCYTDDGLFVGTQNGLLLLKDGERVEEFPLKKVISSEESVAEQRDLLEILKDARTRSVIQDSKGEVWFSTYGKTGLIGYKDGTAIRIGEEDGLPSDRVRTVIERKDGSLLVCGTGGLAVVRDHKVERVYSAKDGLENTEILTAAEMDNGTILIGTDGGGMYAINGDKVTHFGTDEGLKSDVVMRFRKGVTRDLIWIVASNSLAFMDQDMNVTTIEHFPYLNNFDLYENNNGEMWVLSSDGIYVVRVDDLVKNDVFDYLHYGIDNGMHRTPSSNSYSDLTSNGDLYVCCSTGVERINIEEVTETVDHFKTAIPWIEADGEIVYPDENGNFVIGSGVRKLTIYSYVLNYSLVNPVVSRHLGDFEEDWETCLRSEMTPITYTNLKGGEYQFQMKVFDPRGNTSTESSVTIIKKEAPSEMTFFRILVILAVAEVAVVLAQLVTDHRTAVLEKKANEQKELINEIVEAFAKVIDMKDNYTNGHSFRVAHYTAMLAKELGYSEDEVEKFKNIALLHDIGKVGIPKEVLNKPGKLTDEEFATIKSHAEKGYNVLKEISIMPELASGAGSHHERPDGKGYPEGLKGDKIPRAAQIIAVADCFDAMYSTRPYRKRMNFEKVVSIIKEVRGTQLTEDVVDAFLRLVDQGEFRAPDDHGGGSTEDIDNIHRKQQKQAEAEAKAAESETKPAEAPSEGEK